MTYSEILSKLGPCGLNCSKCFAYRNGEIKNLSSKLKANLGNFDIYAERFVDLLDEPIFKKYSDFKLMLNHFTNSTCNGCREDSCKLFKNCLVKQCSKDYCVDYCFQCEQFPCSKHGFDEHLEKRWLAIQNKMKVNGVENYFEEIKDQTRY